MNLPAFRIRTVLLLISVSCSLGAGRAVATDPGYDDLTRTGSALQSLYTMPGDAFEKIWKTWPVAERKDVSDLSATARRAAVFKRYGLVPNPENSRLPLGFLSRNGRLGFNCAACHAGAVLGKTVFGLPNRNVDFYLLLTDLARLRPELSPGFLYARTLFGPEPGIINAWGEVAFALILRDQEMERHVRPTFRGRMTDAVATAPAWWNTRYKKHFFVDGVYPAGERVFNAVAGSQFASGESFRQKSSQTAEILDYARTLQPPVYPGPLDTIRVERGRALFASNCTHCHGTYRGEQVDFPDRIVPVGVVGTDALRATNRSVSAFYRFLQASWIGREFAADYRTNPEPGYVAPVLRGVWATAPYLHNGSVPDLTALLTPATRPALWIPDSDKYDSARVGVIYRSVVPGATLGTLDQRRLYDTRVPGRGNAGHPFGSDLEAEAKLDLIEYLKTL